MYAVKTPNGSMTYFNRKMCGVYEDPLKLAKKCASKCGGSVLVERGGKYRWQRNGKDVYPRYELLN